MFPDARGSGAAVTADASRASRPADPTFRSLFQVDGQSNQAVSATVRELWGRSSGSTAANAAGEGSNGSASASRRLDLFSDPSGTFSGEG